VQSGATDSCKDGFEVLKVGRQELLGRWALQDVVDENLKLFDDFMAMSHFILMTLLENLSDALGLKLPEERLETWHQDHLASKSTLYFLNYPEEVKIKDNGSGQNMHTDIGTLTLLFAPQWGLQVPDKVTKEWQWVQPRPGYAIINVADTLRFLTGGRFRSALHRVFPIDGQVGDRFSVSYFLRANNNTEFKASDGSNSSAKDWYFRKYDTYSRPHKEQRKEPVLTGGMREMIGM
jgi:isopenicillin N synthase-like dioxygenase